MPAVNHRTVASLEAITYRGLPATRVHYKFQLNGEGETSDDVAVYIDGCGYCQIERARHATFFPSHFASERCLSGKRTHCTCDTCF